jgi:uncharacterized phage protein gp47/JayE
MLYEIPTRAHISRSLQTYVRAELPGLDPTPERRSKVGAWSKSLASALFDWYVALADYANHEPYPQTARGAFLFNGWWRPLTKLNPIPATGSRGTVAFVGTLGTTIPKDARLSGNGVTYTVENATAIVAQPVSLTSLTYSASKGVCIVETAGAHLLATGLSVTISGATPAAYNGTFTITATDDNELTYTPTTVPSAPAATGGTLTATWAAATVTAGTIGQRTNLTGTLTMSDTITGVQSTCYATFGGIQGGSDTETAEAYRGRILKALGTDFGAFTGDEIEIVAKSVPGVTRVFVRKASLFGENGVNEGQVKIAFLRDNDANPFPSAQEIADVKAAIVANCMTGNTASEDVIVISPTPHVINFHFTSIAPNTVSMRAAITAQLTQFFDEGVSFGQSIPTLAYGCAIAATYDGDRRQKLGSFVLTTPVGDITIGTDEFPVLGAVTFA